jgi:hypothetical protein
LNKDFSKTLARVGAFLGNKKRQELLSFLPAIYNKTKNLLTYDP